MNYGGSSFLAYWVEHNFQCCIWGYAKSGKRATAHVYNIPKFYVGRKHPSVVVRSYQRLKLGLRFISSFYFANREKF